MNFPRAAASRAAVAFGLAALAAPAASLDPGRAVTQADHEGTLWIGTEGGGVTLLRGGAGDECLRQVAQVLSTALGRAGELVARYGGEEFVALLPGPAEEDASALAERLRAGVEALGLAHAASTASSVVTISGGVATTVADERRSPAETA